MLLIKSHNYTINMDNCTYFCAGSYIKEYGKPTEDGTMFRMTDGHEIVITCVYEILIEQIELHITKFPASIRKSLLILNY